MANAYHPLLGRHLRVEHWANALHQPAVAARTMLGRPASYDRLPYFFTDQYDLGMEYIGHARPGRPTRSSSAATCATREFIAFWLRDGRVPPAMNVNVWDVGEPVRRADPHRARGRRGAAGRSRRPARRPRRYRVAVAHGGSQSRAEPDR